MPGLTDPTASPDFGPCSNTRRADNCARTLPCVGKEGLWFDGQVRGWNQGVVIGTLSNGTPCTGAWKYRDRVAIAAATLTCQDGTKGSVVYYSQDSLTGTGIGRGLDNKGRSLRIWTGKNVLDYLTPKGKKLAELPCGDTPIPIS